MNILKNENLAKYCTLRIGGVASSMFFPESVDDLKLIDLKNSKILGAGSNILINDKKTFDNIVSTSKLNNNVEFLPNGNVFIGTSVRLQKAIAAINKMGMGGLEYLVSIPATLGGAVYMNASVYTPEFCGISDYLLSVSVFYRGRVEKWDKQKCEFAKRYSIFHKVDAIILGAEFSFPKQEIALSKKKIADRLAIAKKQDKSGGNCGSVFKECSIPLMKFLQKIHLRFGKVCFSTKSTNWLINMGGGTFSDVKKLLWCAKFLHKLFGKNIQEEIIEWK